MTKNTVELLSYLKKSILYGPPVQRNACYLNWLTVNGGLSLYVSLGIG